MFEIFNRTPQGRVFQHPKIFRDERTGCPTPWTSSTLSTNISNRSISPMCRRPKVAIFLGKKSLPWFPPRKCCSLDFITPRSVHVERKICSASLMCPQTTHVVPLPTFNPSSNAFLVQSDGDVPHLGAPNVPILPLISCEKYPEWSRHLHLLLLPRSCKSHVADKHPPWQQTQL